MKTRIGSKPDEGFTLLEVLFALTLLTLMLITVGMGIHSAAVVAQEIQRDLMVQTRAQAFVDSALAVSFGNITNLDPTAEQLNEMFDEDPVLGDITLHQLSRWPTADEGWRFSLAKFPVDGEWRVQVSHDLNDDGVIAGQVESTLDAVALRALEESKQVFRIRVFFNDKLILATNRSAEVSQ